MIGHVTNASPLNLVKSNATLISTVIEDSKYAFNITCSKVNLEGVYYKNVTEVSNLPTPTIVSYSPVNVTTPSANIQFNISGKNLKVIGVYMDGKPISFSSTSTSSGILVTIPFNASVEPSGAYYVTIEVCDGLKYNLSAIIFNSYHEVEEAKVSASLSSNISSVSTSLSSLSSNISSVSTSLSNEISSVSVSLSHDISSASASSTDGEILGSIGIVLGLIAILLFVFRGRGEKK
jgi:hypothetical protein